MTHRFSICKLKEIQFRKDVICLHHYTISITKNNLSPRIARFYSNISSFHSFDERNYKFSLHVFFPFSFFLHKVMVYLNILKLISLKGYLNKVALIWVRFVSYILNRFLHFVIISHLFKETKCQFWVVLEFFVLIILLINMLSMYYPYLVIVCPCRSTLPFLAFLSVNCVIDLSTNSCIHLNSVSKCQN